MGKVIKELSHRNIKLNITAVYNSSQTKKILKCLNKRSKTIISIFAGRAGDVGKDPNPELKKSVIMSKKYPRNMIGYGSNEIKVNWPNNARLALQIVLN